MSYFKKIINGFFSLIKGMGITLKYFFLPAKTLLYPYERPKIPVNSRSMLTMNYYSDSQKTKCTACGMCVKVCPVKAIELKIHLEKDGTKKLSEYIFDHQKCMYCGLCTENCPFKAISWDSEQFENAGYCHVKKHYPSKEIIEHSKK